MLSAHPLAVKFNSLAINLDNAGKTTFSSHAHSDHASGLKKTELLLASEQTIDFMKAREYGVPVNVCSKSDFSLDGVKMSFLNAGHVLGSRQFFAQASEESFLYTGDFKTEDTLVDFGAKAVDADVLLMECTYGLPKYSFSSREQTYEKMRSWVQKQVSENKNVVLGGYSLGKAQELIKFLNSYCSITPVVNPTICAVNKVYEKHGVKLSYLNPQSEQNALSKQFVAVLPFHQVNQSLKQLLQTQYSRKTSIALATGWSMTRSFKADTSFALSDHCDYNSLIEFVKQVNPRKVYCIHGFAKEFAYSLSKLGFNACALEQQQTLLNYNVV